MSKTNNFTEKNIGDSAVWTRPDGSSQSVTITGVDLISPGCEHLYPNDTDEVRISWPDSVLAVVHRSVYLPRSRWNELTLFPAGCKFLAI